MYKDDIREFLFDRLRIYGWRIVLLWVLLVFGAGINIVLAQSVETDLTSHHVVVDIDFAGATITLFGTTVDKQGVKFQPKPDIIVVVEGPAQSVQLQKKSRIAGIWVNQKMQVFENTPAYLAVLSNRPLEQITKPEILLKQDIGFASLSRELVGRNLDAADINSTEFSDSLVRLMREKKRFRLNTGGVIFVGEHLFRANFRVPADVPTGNYLAKIYLFREGVLEGVAETSFNIRKTGIEKLIYTTAHEMPLVYGILSVLMAIAAGMGASYLFRNR